MLRMSRSITSAGCLIIGDEVLNGKILDTNSHFFARKCFDELHIPLRKTIVCGDDENDIVQSLAELQKNCDFIVTSGGIGPTHDDITYQSLAAAYGLLVQIDQETKLRMSRIRGLYVSGLEPLQQQAFYRMATFPKPSATVPVSKFFAADDLWVPVVGINSQVYVLPGVPQLFQRLLNSLCDSLKSRIVPHAQTRFFVKTSSKESELAPFLTLLQEKCNVAFGPGAVKLGSYPHFAWKINTISIIGDSSVSKDALRGVVDEVLGGIGGDAEEISAEKENEMSTSEPEKQKE